MPVQFGTADTISILGRLLLAEQDTLDVRQKPFLLEWLVTLCKQEYESLGLQEDLDRLIDYQDQRAAYIGKNSMLYLDLGLSLYERFKLSAQVLDAQNAITHFKTAHSLSLGQDEDNHTPQACIASVHHRLYVHSNELADLESAITLMSQVVRLSPEDLKDKSKWLHDLALMHQSRFERHEELVDIDDAIYYMRRAITLVVYSDTTTFYWLGQLALLYQNRFGRLGDLSNLDIAIEYANQARSLADEKSAKYADVLNTLGISYLSRYDTLGSSPDCDQAIEFLAQGLLLLVEGDPRIPVRLGNLGNCYHSRFMHLGEIEDLHQAQQLLDKAVHLAHDSRIRGHLINNLGNLYALKFEEFNISSDCDEAIGYLTQVESSVSEEFPKKARQLSGLSGALITRFQRLGQISDIDQAIDLMNQVLDITPDPHKERPSRLYALGNAYQTRSEYTGDPQDVHRAIIDFSQACLLTPEKYRIKPSRLNGLGSCYTFRFKIFGHVKDIDNAIEYLELAVSLSSDKHLYKPTYLFGLGSALRTRFERLGQLFDIDLAIRHVKSSVLLSSVWNSRSKSKRLSLLIACYESRFDRLGHLADINQAISCGIEATSIDLSNDHMTEKIIHDNLGTVYRKRFEHTGEFWDIDEAIRLQLHGLSLIPDHQAIKPILLHNLGSSYNSRFIKSSRISDLNHAVSYRREAVRLALDQADKVGFLLDLAMSYERRYSVQHDLDDVSEAIVCLQEAAQMSTGHPYLRLRAARRWGRLAFLHRVPSALSAYQQAISLIPNTVWLGSSVKLRFETIKSINDVVAEAVMVAVQLNEFDTALKWFEQGRSIVWNQMLQLRTPLDELRAFNEDLADRLESASNGLLNFRFNALQETEHVIGSMSTEQMTRNQRSLAFEWEHLIEEVRRIPRFQQFLEPKSSAQLHQAAQSAIVVINVHISRCDALALLPGSDSVVHIPLPLLSINACTQMKDKISDIVRGNGNQLELNKRSVRGPKFYPDQLQDGFENILEDLWVTTVHPVLSALGYLDMKNASKPRVTWCATGPLSFLPLHAAGVYAQPAKRAFDFIYSSYTPTVGSLITPSKPEINFAGLLAVGQSATNSQSPLPATITELDYVQERAGSISFTRIDEKDATTATVMAQIQTHSWVHFACHASQNLDDPSASAFHLHDGDMSLSQISGLSLKNAQFAFLSACETATGDESLPEEAIHLAAGMIMTGFSTVVATMWSIHDQDGPVVADGFYSNMFKDGIPDNRNAAGALDKAVEMLREKVGERNFERWVPFIHMGQ